MLLSKHGPVVPLLPVLVALTACSSAQDEGRAASGGAGGAGDVANAGAAPATGGATGSTGGASSTGGAGGATGGTTSPGGGASSGGQGTGAAASGGATTSGGAAGSTAGGSAGVAGSAGATSTGGAGGAGASDGGPPSRTTCKRGVAYGEHSKADMAALSPASAWWYNWYYRPDTDLLDGSYRTERVEYVPMVWGGSFDVQTLIADIPSDARVLLGFNEPNFGAQSNLSASAAAALWPEVEQIADARGLYLVSPAVNFCGGSCQDTSPFDYLDDFFAACAGCRVDAVAFHIYVGCNQSGQNQAEWLINHVETYKQRFSQPLWLTEFACTDAAGFDDQIAFLEDAVAYLEAEPRVERYSWFSGRFQSIPYVDLLGADGALTPLGEAYVAAPKSADCPD